MYEAERRIKVAPMKKQLRFSWRSSIHLMRVSVCVCVRARVCAWVGVHVSVSLCVCACVRDIEKKKQSVFFLREITGCKSRCSNWQLCVCVCVRACVRAWVDTHVVHITSAWLWI